MHRESLSRPVSPSTSAHALGTRAPFPSPLCLADSRCHPFRAPRPLRGCLGAHGARCPVQRPRLRLRVTQAPCSKPWVLAAFQGVPGCRAEGSTRRHTLRSPRADAGLRPPPARGIPPSLRAPASWTRTPKGVSNLSLPLRSFLAALRQLRDCSPVSLVLRDLCQISGNHIAAGSVTQGMHVARRNAPRRILLHCCSRLHLHRDPSVKLPDRFIVK